MRLRAIHFENYRLLRDTVLPLEPLTVLVGPNDSGKSSVLRALAEAAHSAQSSLANSMTYGAPPQARVAIEFELAAGNGPPVRLRKAFVYRAEHGRYVTEDLHVADGGADAMEPPRAMRALTSARVFAPVAAHLRQAVTLTPAATLQHDAANLPVALDRLRDRHPDRWEALNAELPAWLPAFDQVLFDTPGEGMRALVLRRRQDRVRVPAADLSDGTLLVLALLAIVHAEEEACIIGLEEPETGMHPRLLRQVRDALLRIAYPAENGIDREPRQVIATTHSPYLLDLFRDMPENVVVAERRERDVTFHRITDRSDIDAILEAGPLGEAWFTGVLGGVPAEPLLGTEPSER